MKTPRRASSKATGGKDAKGKTRVKVRDIVPRKDAKGGRTTVKDSHDR